jgi:ParB family chromosome partitioning protein
VYEAEGGAIVSDLFAEDEDAPCYLSDRALVTRLAEAKLAPLAENIAAEGWGWVEIALDGIAWQRFPDRIRQQRRELSDDERADQERLYAELDAAEGDAEIARIEDAIDALARVAWGADEIALAGAIISLGHDGTPKLERGLVRAEDVKALKTLRRKASGSAHSESDADTAAERAASTSGIPAKLVDELLAHKTWGLRIAIASDPDLALKALVFTLAGRLFEQPRRSTCLSVAVDEADVCRSITRAASKAPADYAGLVSQWRKRLPGDDSELWAYIVEAERATLLELLAVLIAPGIDLRLGSHTRENDPRAASGALFAEAAGLDMSSQWTATAESYFAHVKREVILDAIREAKPGALTKKLQKSSKADVLARAKGLFKDSAWLPEPLRVTRSDRPNARAIAAE